MKDTTWAVTVRRPLRRCYRYIGANYYCFILPVTSQTLFGASIAPPSQKPSIPVSTQNCCHHVSWSLDPFFCLSCKVCVFTPKHPKPLSVYEDVCDAPHLGAVFLKDARTCAGGDGRQEEEGDPHWSDSSSLYFLSSQQASITHIHSCCWGRREWRRVCGEAWGWGGDLLSHPWFEELNHPLCCQRQ